MSNNIFFKKNLTNGIKTPFIRNFLSLFAGNISGQLVIILSSPILSRLYNPSSFGLLELVLSIFSILSVIVNLKLENAIVIQKNKGEASKVLSLCFFVNFFMFLFGMSSLFILYYNEVSFFSKILSNWWWAPPLLGFFSGIQQAMQMYFIRCKNYRIISIVLFLQGIGLVSFQLLYGYIINYNSSALVMSYIINNLIVCLIFFIFLMNSEKPEIKIHLKNVLRKVLECKNFIFYTVPTSLLGAISQRSLFLTLGVFFSETDVGLAGLAMRVMYFPITLVTRSMGQVFFGTFSEKIGEADFAEQINKILRVKILTVFFIIPLIINAPNLFKLCFGDKWGEAGYYAALLSPASFMLFLTGWLDRTHDVASLQKKAFSLELCYNVSIILIMIIISYFFNHPLYLVGAFGFFTSAYNIIWLVLTLKIIGISYQNSLKNIFLLILCVSGFLLFYLFLQWLMGYFLLTISFYYVLCSMGVILLMRRL